MHQSVSKVLLTATITIALVCCMATTAFASEISAGAGTVTASALKLRAEASTSSACLTLLAKDTNVVVEDASNPDWYKVSYNGQTGYLSAEYVTFAKTLEAKLGNGTVSGDSVNVRSAASTSASKVAMLNKGATVEIIGIDDGWFKISFSGKTGYLRSDYMSVGGSTASGTVAVSAKSADVVTFAKQFLGVRYVYGGASPKGFDCSGYVMYVMKQYGVSLPHTASGQLGYGTSIDKSALQPGDLVFFRDPSRAGGKPASHSGIYIGNGQFIHASSGGGKVQINNLTDSYYAKYYTGARHVL